MSVPPAVAARYVVQALEANATYRGLRAGTKTYRLGLPRDLDLSEKPGVIVEVPSAVTPTEYVRSDNVNEAQAVTVTTHLVYQGESTAKLEVLLATIHALVKNRFSVSVQGGTMVQCTEGLFIEYSETLGDDRYIHWVQEWQIQAVATGVIV